MYIDQCSYEEIYEPEHMYVFTGPCVITGKPYTVRIKGPDLFKIRQGEYIQSACPYMSDEDREFCISGVSPEAFDMLTGRSDEEETPVGPVMDYRNVTPQEFEQAVFKVAEQKGTAFLLGIPGVWEIVSEHLNNEALAICPSAVVVAGEEGDHAWF